MERKTVSEALRNVNWACNQFRDAYEDKSGDASERRQWLDQCVADLRECIEELREAQITSDWPAKKEDE
jgi:hypothetical protein